MHTRKGFTLIELVVVIAILGILAGIAIPRFMEAQSAARGARIEADMRSMESALTMYIIDNTLPTGITAISVLTTGSKKYLASVPVIPTGTAKFANGFELENVDGSKSKYVIRYNHTTGANILLQYYANGGTTGTVGQSFTINMLLGESS